jgi:hypothetical protein
MAISITGKHGIIAGPKRVHRTVDSIPDNKPRTEVAYCNFPDSFKVTSELTARIYSLSSRSIELLDLFFFL